MVALAKIFGKAVVDASNDPPSFSKLTVLFDNSAVDIRIVVSTLLVVFGFGTVVVLSNKVEDIAVVKTFIVILANVVVEVVCPA